MRISIICFVLVLLLSCGKNQQAFEILEVNTPYLIPEGIIYDETSNTFYLSGLHEYKIVSFGRYTGEIRDFIIDGYAGYGMGVGMKIDQENRRLITLSSSNTDGTFSSLVHFWNLDDPNDYQEIIRSDTAGFFFNDLVIDRPGNIIITDTEASRIWMIEKGDTNLQVIYEEPELYPNGIAYDPEQDQIYIASWQKGIVRLDRQKNMTYTIHPEDVKASQGIDGLYFYNNSLIGIQNGYEDLSKHNIVRFHLNDQFMVSSTDTLAINHSSFNVPTTGVVVGDRFYCIANSQLDNLNQQTNEIIDSTLLTPIYILGISLNDK